MGLEATRRIRKNGLRDQLRLVLNSSGSPRYHADALAAGCDDCIEKPFDLDWLRTYLFCSLQLLSCKEARELSRKLAVLLWFLFIYTV
jgi:CheY-like chemotaxis protein